MPQEPRRLLATWTAEEGESSFVVRTANGFVVSITYFHDEPNRDFNLRKAPSGCDQPAARVAEEGRAMKLADIEIPPDVARRFVQDMLAYFAETNPIKRDEIAARLDRHSRRRTDRCRPMGLAVRLLSGTASGRAWRSSMRCYDGGHPLAADCPI